MQAKNKKEVTIAWLRFSLTLILTVVLSITMFYCFVHTSAIELNKIEEKTLEYDHIYSLQLETTLKVDSLVHLIQLLNTNARINDVLLQNMISNKKMNLLHHLEKMPEKDTRVYKMLAMQFNEFLNAKDSIRLLSMEEQLVREDLIQCINNNKVAARQLSIGSATSGFEHQ
jgi:hypothetical protein